MANCQLTVLRRPSSNKLQVSRLSNIRQIIAGLEKLAEVPAFDEIRKELIEGHGWDDDLTKVFGNKTVRVRLKGSDLGDFAKIVTDWSFQDRSGIYVYEDGEDAEDAAQNIDALAQRIVTEDAAARKARQAKEKAHLSQVRKERRDREKQEESKAKAENKKRTEGDRHKIHDTKAFLVDRGWKLSRLLGYYNTYGDVKVFLTFVGNKVIIGSDVKLHNEVDISELAAYDAAERIDSVAKKMVALYKDGPDVEKPKFNEMKLLHGLRELGWVNGHVDGGVIRAVKELDGTELPCLITLSFDPESGRVNFAWISNHEHPRQNLTWHIKMPTNTKKILGLLNDLSDMVQKRVRKLDAERAQELAKAQEKKEEEEAYNAWKLKQLGVQKKKDQEGAWKERLERELKLEQQPRGAIPPLNTDPTSLQNLTQRQQQQVVAPKQQEQQKSQKPMWTKYPVTASESRVAPGRWYIQIISPGERAYFRGLKTQKNGGVAGILFIEASRKAVKSSVNRESFQLWKEIQEEQVPSSIREKILARMM